jgi:hypothetical protein
MFASKIILIEKISELIPDGTFDQALAARNKVILVCEPSELRSLGDTARRSVAPESTTTLAARELRPRDQ